MKLALKSKYTFIIILVLVISTSGCVEDVSRTNYDLNKMNPLTDDEYQPIPYGEHKRTAKEDEFKDDIDEIIHGGLSNYVNRQVSPYQGKLPCDNYYPTPDFNYDENGDKKSCIAYRKEQFGETAGADIAAYIKSEERRGGTRAKKKAFFRAFGPLAVKIQDETGYPASALLSQWAEETGWGINSRLLRKGNGIGGHSCFKRQSVVEYNVFRAPGTNKRGTINASCTYARPANEKHYYLTFKTLEDSAYAQVHNILYKRGTQRNYKNARREVFSSVESKTKANPYKVLDGLVGYAAAPPTYRQRLKNRVRDEGLEKFDDLTICKKKGDDNEK